MLKTRGTVGTPLIEIHTRFYEPATCGETIDVHTTIEAWAAKTLRHRHVVKRGDAVVCEGTEARAFEWCSIRHGRRAMLAAPHRTGSRPSADGRTCTGEPTTR